jgi:feruloyl esterase
VQNTPNDFDGAVSMYPAWNAASLDLQFGRITRALAKPGAYPNPRKQLVWVNAVIAACDELDGLKDGLVSNTGACRFDPATVRSAGGADTVEVRVAASTSVRTSIDRSGACFGRLSKESGLRGSTVHKRPGIPRPW